MCMRTHTDTHKMKCNIEIVMKRKNKQAGTVASCNGEVEAGPLQGQEANPGHKDVGSGRKLRAASNPVNHLKQLSKNSAGLCKSSVSNWNSQRSIKNSLDNKGHSESICLPVSMQVKSIDVPLMVPSNEGIS